ncbi:MAG: serine protein kinase [Epulopiscium sp. Nuni2H_MBin003]|nr:MAG: serine protein kinase [Epulopiscium sp. Nuni2H_MBin003]
MDFLDIILNERKNKSISKKYTFLEYLHIIKDKKDLVKLSHQRIYDEIIKYGSETNKNDIKIYNVFKDRFFGIDETLEKVVRYFFSAAMGAEESRQILYLVGPVGVGKSSLIDAIKEILENSDAIYALEGCPMREEPLHLIPKASRHIFEDILGIKIEGELCPKCRHRLESEFDGRYEDFPVVEVDFSVAKRQGVGVVPPVDPNNQDTSVLVGSVDLSKMDLYAEDDPRVFSLNGAFHVANRGVIEFIEVFKNDIEYLYTMLTATQEKLIPSPAKGAMIYFDGVILAHSNETEWNKFRTDKTNEAILDRIVKIELPYCLELDSEIKIYEKLLSKSCFNVHIAPNTLKIAAMFSILTRLLPSNKVDNITKLRVYNGEKIVIDNKVIDIEFLKEEVEDEGMSGVSVRFVMKTIDSAIAISDGCLEPMLFIKTLVKEVKSLSVSKEVKNNYLNIIHDNLKKEYHKLLEDEVTKAFIYGYKEQAEDMFNNYLDHAEAYINKTKVEGNIPDENFMRAIEEELGITGSGAKGFRQDVTSYMFTLVRSGAEISYDCYAPLKQAIEKRITYSVRELTRIITVNKVRGNEQNIQYNNMLEQMQQNGYCKSCADATLVYASNNLWKD